MNKQLLKEYVMQFVGTPYHYGGSNPMTGFDCSGLVMECLMAMGVFPYGTRLNAQMLHDHFIKEGKLGGKELGALAFYGKGPHGIDHVGMFLDDRYVIEAAGGTAQTTNLADAVQHNAFVKIRSFDYRHDFVESVLPNVMQGV